MLEKGVEIVGAIDVNPDYVGRDVGEIVGLDVPLGIIVSDDADTVLSENPADVALVCIAGGLDKMSEHYERCIDHELNVLSVSEDFVYPWHTEADPAIKLDLLAKRRGVSLASSGLQDVFMVTMAVVSAGACQAIDSFDLYMESNLGHANPDACRGAGIGGSKENFEKIWAETPISLQSLTSLLDSIAADWQLERKSGNVRFEPILALEDTSTPTLGENEVIKRGDVLGYKLVVDIATDRCPMTYTVAFMFYEEGRPDLSPMSIRIDGDPSVHLTFNDIDVHRATCIQMVNRIPDIINCEPGLVTSEQLPRPKYKAHNLNYYIE